MLARRAVIALLAASTKRREKVLPGAMNATVRSISSFGNTVSPETVTPETVYTSPSVMPAVMNMSFLSPLISTWVESMLKSMWPRSRYQEFSFSMSPESFSREYWSSRLYQLSQLLVCDSQPLVMSSSV